MPGGVVVTGASTGIGAAIARTLAKHGFRTFGTVRRTENESALKQAGVVPVRMDVTDGESIRRAHEIVLETLGGQQLVGLVNNAGTPGAGPTEHLPLDELRRVFEVNVIGVVAVTQAFLPELRRSRGRIVNMSSVAGRLALPFMGPYSASKFALEAISDTLRRELIPAGIDVIIIEPGSIRTPIWDKVTGLDLGPYAGTPYESALHRVLESLGKRKEHGMPPEAVADAVLQALTARRPPARIPVVRKPVRKWLTNLLPDRWIDRLVAKRLWGVATRQTRSAR